MEDRRFAKILAAELSEPFFGRTEAIEERRDRIAEKLHRVMSQQGLVDSIKRSSYFGAPNRSRDYEVRRVLLRALCLVADPVQDFLSLALDDDREWYVRRDALRFLSERAESTDLVRLLPLVADSRLGGEIRHAALRALSENGIAEVLEVIRRDDFTSDWYQADLHLTIARARLGDSSALDDLLTLTVDDSGHRRHAVADVLEELVTKMGGADAVARHLLAEDGRNDTNDALLTLLTESTDERAKIWAMGRRPWNSQADMEALTGCLGSDSWRVRHAASEKLKDLGSSAEVLLEVLRSDSAERRQKLWALRTLLGMNLQPDAELIDSVGELYVPWEFDVDTVARQIVVAQFAGRAQPGTDVRYEIEQRLQDRSDDFDVEGMKRKLRQALVSHGLECAEWLEVGDYHGSGSGQCWVLDVADHAISLNKSGPYALVRDSPSNDPTHELISQTLASCEITVLSADQLAHIVPDLNVYYFGARKPLSLGQLLFYWQD